MSLCTPATRKRDCLTALCLCSTKFLLEVYKKRRLYGAVATAYPLPGCPYFVLYFLMVRLLFEGDGISPPRPPGSASRLLSLRSGQGRVRYVVLFLLRGLLVDSSRR